MGFIGVLPESPSFGQQLSKGIGQGISQGVSKASDFASEMAMQKYKANQKTALMNRIEGGNVNSPTSSSKPGDFNEDTAEQFRDFAQSLEKKAGKELTPKDLDELFPIFHEQILKSGQKSQQGSSQEVTPEKLRMKAKQYAAAGEDSLARATSSEAESLEKSVRQDSEHEFKREQKSEDSLQQINDRLLESDRQIMRFGRLGELFSPEFEDKFPPAAMAALFTKNGELNPLALSQLSDEAQEAIKLTYDQLTGAKETFGGRVTNFDAQTYLKRHPGLLNSAEGRRKVLRDLQIMNDITNLHDRELLNIVEEYGGAGKISISKAENIFRKRFQPQLDDMRDEFINPEKTEFTEMPDPKRYIGAELEDPETGQKFVSDGKEWKLK